MVREDGADVELGFEALAKGSFNRIGGSRPKSRVYRSKARRERYMAMSSLRKGEESKSCLHTLGHHQEAEEDEKENVQEKSRLLCERILRLNAQKKPSQYSFASDPQPKRGVGLQPKAKFVAVSTGMSVKYLEWGSSGEVVVLLHGIGECSEVWCSIATKLAEHGYHVFALDLRGHGQTTWSSSQLYTAQSMATDLKDIFLELDLYRSKCALVGVDIGAAVAAEFACLYPRLVAVLACIDYDAVSKDSRLSYCKVQAASNVLDYESATALLTSPLLKDQQRVKASAEKVVPLMFTQEGKALGLKPKMDPKFFFSASMASLGHSLASVKCSLLVLHSFGKDTLERMRLLLESTSASFVRVEKSSGYALSDSPFEVYSALKKVLGKCNAFVDEEPHSRTPEALGLRPLPQFGSLEEAFKALGPRNIPNREEIQAELDKLRDEEGECVSEDDNLNNAHTTSLSNNPSDYFGMIG